MCLLPNRPQCLWRIIIEAVQLKLMNLESHLKPPRQITIVLDVTDDLVHGNQEEAFFNPY